MCTKIEFGTQRGRGEGMNPRCTFLEKCTTGGGGRGMDPRCTLLEKCTTGGGGGVLTFGRFVGSLIQTSRASRCAVQCNGLCMCLEPYYVQSSLAISTRSGL